MAALLQTLILHYSRRQPLLKDCSLYQWVHGCDEQAAKTLCDSVLVFGSDFFALAQPALKSLVPFNSTCQSTSGVNDDRSSIKICSKNLLGRFRSMDLVLITFGWLYSHVLVSYCWDDYCWSSTAQIKNKQDSASSSSKDICKVIRKAILLTFSLIIANARTIFLQLNKVFYFYL